MVHSENGERELTKHIHRGFARLCILILLAKKERYGYLLVKELNKTANAHARILRITRKSPGKISTSEVYSILSGLEKRGFIASHRTAGSRPKKVFRITRRGLRMLHAGKKRLLIIFRIFKLSFPEVFGG